MTKLHQWFLKIVNLNSKKFANTVESSLLILLGLLIFFLCFISFMKVDITIPMKISPPNSIDISKIYSSVLKETPKIVLKYKNHRYTFESTHYDYRYFDSIKITLSKPLPPELFKLPPHKIRFVIERRSILSLLFRSGNITKEIMRH